MIVKCPRCERLISEWDRRYREDKHEGWTEDGCRFCILGRCRMYPEHEAALREREDERRLDQMRDGTDL